MRKHGGYQKKNHQNGKDIHHRYQGSTRALMSVSKDSAFGLLRHRLDMISSDRIDASQYWRSLELALTESRNGIDRLYHCHFQGCSQYSPLLLSCAREVIKADRGHQAKRSAVHGCRILAASRDAFWAGLAPANCRERVDKTMMVPSSPKRWAIFESSRRYCVRFSSMRDYLHHALFHGDLRCLHAV